MTLVRRWAPWALLVAVAVAVLAIGFNRSSHPTLDSQVHHIAGLVRCPVCNGESAAVSDAAPSVAIRAQIRQELQAGEHQGQILAGLVRSYGPGILEKPQSSGLALVVWVVPVVAVVLGGAGLGLAFARWRSRSEPGPGQPRVAPEGEGAPRGGAALVPAAAGRSAAVGAAVGSATVGSAAAVTPGPTAGTGPTGAAPPDSGTSPTGRRPSRWRWAAAGVGVALVAGGASWAVVASSGTRLPGQEITGQALPSQTVAAELHAADRAMASNDAVTAMKDYQKVLSAEPTQAQALTGEGWILAETQQPALLRQGLGLLVAAEKSDPSYPPAHVYRGLALLSEADYADSVPELQWYLDHSPDPQLVDQVNKALAEAQAGQAAAAKGASAAPAG